MQDRPETPSAAPPSAKPPTAENAAADGAGPAGTDAPRMMSWRRQVLVAAAVLGVGLTALGPGRAALDAALTTLGLTEPAPSEKKSAKKRKGGRAAPSVVLAETTEARDDLTLRLTGGAVAVRFADLKPRASGRVTEVLFEGGDRLKAGQPILRLDDRRERLALESAEVALKEALRVRDRAKRLTGAGTGSAAASDKAETEAEIARIARDDAKEALEDRTVVAPFDGVVSLPRVEIGDRVETNDSIASFDDRSTLLVEAAAPEAAFGRLRFDAPVTATTIAFPGERFEGRIAEKDSRIDAAARTITIRAEIPNAEDKLRPGMSFTLTLALPGAPAIAAPEIALQWERQGAYLWRVSEGRAERVPVQLLARQDGLALVRNLDGAEKPLNPGDKVVIEGVQRLKDGGRVKIVGAGERSRAPAADALRRGGRAAAPNDARLAAER